MNKRQGSLILALGRKKDALSMNQHTGQISRQWAPIVFIAGFVMLMVLGGCRGSVSDKKIDFIDLNRAMELYDEGLEDSEKVLFIDVRKPERYNAGHIMGARNIRVNEIYLKYDADPELLKFDHLVVYGENPGSASARAMAKRMIEAEYNTMLKARVRLFLGGWIVWESSGLPVGVVEVPNDTSEDEEAQTEGDE